MKHRKTLWNSCVLVLCLWAGWQTLVGANSIRPRPSAARPYVQGTGYFPQGGRVDHQPRKTDAGAAPAGKPAVSYARLPMTFEANQGQTNKAVKFLSRGRGYGLFLTDDSAVLELEKPSVVSSPLSVVGTKSSRAMNASQRTTDDGQRTLSYG